MPNKRIVISKKVLADARALEVVTSTPAKLRVFRKRFATTPKAAATIDDASRIINRQLGRLLAAVFDPERKR